jgi:hypothetical protein
LVAIIFDLLLSFEILVLSDLLHDLLLVVSVKVLDLGLVLILHMLDIFGKFLLELSFLLQ